MGRISFILLLQIVEAVIGFLRDPHPRVRYAACNAIGQMATDFAPVFQKKFHESVVPGLLLVMEDGVNPRVQVCELLACGFEAKETVCQSLRFLCDIHMKEQAYTM